MTVSRSSCAETLRAKLDPVAQLAEGYAPMRHQVEVGFKRLSDFLEHLYA